MSLQWECNDERSMAVAIMDAVKERTGSLNVVVDERRTNVM